MRTLLSRLKTLWCDLKCYIDSFDKTTREDSTIKELILDITRSITGQYSYRTIVNEIGSFVLDPIETYGFKIQFSDTSITNIMADVTNFYFDGNSLSTKVIQIGNGSGYIDLYGFTYDNIEEDYNESDWRKVMVKISIKDNG